MSFVTRRAAIAVGFAVLGSACGGSSAVAPATPTAPVAVAPVVHQVPAGGPGSPTSSSAVGDDVPYVESAGAYPEGFLPKFRVQPGPDEEGVIHGDSPLTVEFDTCGSTAEAGKTLHFVFDWDYDHQAEIVGTGDACRQTHTYRTAADGAARTIRTNVCVVNGDPQAAGTYVSCRTTTVTLAASSSSAGLPRFCGVFFNGDYTLCLQGRNLSQDSGNNGSFEEFWYVNDDGAQGEGACPAGTSFSGSEVGNYEISEPAFYAFMLSHGFTGTNDFCVLD